MPVWLYNVASMGRIRKLGLAMFDENGQVFVRNHFSFGQEQMSGDIFLTELIDYWIEQDAPYAYRFCTQIKELLDAYNEKYGS